MNLILNTKLFGGMNIPFPFSSEKLLIHTTPMEQQQSQMSYGIDVWLLRSKIWQRGSSINKALGYQDSLVKSLLSQIKES